MNEEQRKVLFEEHIASAKKLKKAGFILLPIAILLIIGGIILILTGAGVTANTTSCPSMGSSGWYDCSVSNMHAQSSAYSTQSGFFAGGGTAITVGVFLLILSIVFVTEEKRAIKMNAMEERISQARMKDVAKESGSQKCPYCGCGNPKGSHKCGGCGASL